MIRFFLLLIIFCFSGCNNCDTKNQSTLPDAATCKKTNIKPSPQALCAETVVRVCKKYSSCDDNQPNNNQLDCEVEMIGMCAGFSSIKEEDADGYYLDCLDSIDIMTCEEFLNGFPQQCKSYLVE